MKVAISAAVVAASLLPAPAMAGTVRVAFADPDRFTDFATFDGPPARVLLDILERHLVGLGQRLGPREGLRVEILDADQAGQYELRGPVTNNVRIVRDSSPPRIRLRYELVGRGRAPLRGDEVLTDLNFALEPRARFNNGPLFFETTLLTEWFARRFGSGGG